MTSEERYQKLHYLYGNRNVYRVAMLLYVENMGYAKEVSAKLGLSATYVTQIFKNLERFKLAREVARENKLLTYALTDLGRRLLTP